MPVSSEIREIEVEIDAWVGTRRWWLAPRDILLRKLFEYYRDFLDICFAKMTHDLIFTGETQLGALEDRVRAGIWQSIKWTMEFCHEPGRGDAKLTPKRMKRLNELSQLYEVWVDILKAAEQGDCVIEADRDRRLIIVHEGPDLTGADFQLIAHQQRTNAFHAHTSFVADGDQLTQRWNAGDYRRLALRLFNLPEVKLARVFSSTGHLLYTRPSIIEISDIPDDDGAQRVLEDLTLTVDMIKGPNGEKQKWRLVSMLDVPFVKVGSLRLGTADAAQALAGRLGEDHMVRRALQVDEKQYSIVSGLREDRMIEAVKARLEHHGWKVSPRYRLHGPEAEIDIYATRVGAELLLGLRSMSRPLTPPEVRGRDDWIIKDIHHTADLLSRFSDHARGFVITNGYRGDYVTWPAALGRSVMIGTIDDVDDIGTDPTAAADILKRRVGFDPTKPPPSQPSGVSFKLKDWRIEFAA
jgi:hypothetical protein